MPLVENWCCRVTALLVCCMVAPTAAQAVVIDAASARLGGSPQLMLVSAKNTHFAVTSIDGAPGTVIPLKIELAKNLSNGAPAGSYTFMMFKGLPDGFRLSAGFRTKNAWLVAIKDLEGLAIEVPDQYQGEFSVEASLYRGETIEPERENFSVRVSTRAQKLQAGAVQHRSLAVSAEPETTDAIALPKRDPSLTKDEEDAMIAQGEAQINSGNIVFARLLFEQLSARGSARGTFELGKTYDPTELRSINTVGIQGDAEKARELYRKAVELGSTQAVKALEVLEK